MSILVVEVLYLNENTMFDNTRHIYTREIYQSPTGVVLNFGVYLTSISNK